MRYINQITHYNLHVWLVSFTFTIFLCALQNVLTMSDKPMQLANRKSKVCFSRLNIFLE